MRSKLLYREKFNDFEGNIIEMVIWKVPISLQYPDGVKYRMAFIPYGAPRPVVLYDNHAPKGYHRHLGKFEKPYTYSNVDNLLKDFKKEIHLWKDSKGKYS